MAEICSDGDVVFIVGDEKRRLRVSSMTLKRSSSVFNVLLGPKFSEGQGLLSEGSAEIPLPEDDPDALTTIFCVLHGHNDRVPEVIPADKLYDIAVLTDKYDVFIPLKFAIHQWLITAVSTNDSSKLWTLLSVAFLARHQRAFSNVCRGLVWNHAGSYATFVRRDELFQDVAASICLALEEQRTQLRLRLMGGFYVLQDVQAYSCACGWNAHYFHSILKKYGPDLKNIHDQQQSLSQTFDWAKTVTVTARPAHLQATSCGSRTSSHWPWAEEFVPKLRAILDGISGCKGLCLACICGDSHTIHGNE